MGEFATVVPTPSRCFCQITLRDLKPWARLKYVEHVPTLRLLQMAKGAEEREAIGIVALLDVPDDEVIRMLSPLSQAHCNILACRDHVRDWLRGMVSTLQPAECAKHSRTLQA